MPSISARSDQMTDPASSVPAIWYDGISAVRHEGTARWEGDGLSLEAGPDAREIVPFDRLTYVETTGRHTVVGQEDRPDFRLRLPRDLPQELANRLPTRREYGGWVDRLGLGKAALIFAGASAIAVALFVTAPGWLGPRVPEAWENRLGQAMVGDMGGRLCSTPESDAALAKLLAAVDPATPKARVGIANIKMVNAVALPGAQVLLFDELVQEAESPEELAGVLGHEIGHVRERHVMTSLLRQFGLSVLLSGANTRVGDTVLGLTQMGYSREAEREADRFARARLAASDISPIGSAEFFERLSKEEDGNADEDEAADAQEAGGPSRWLASHPSTRERARAYRAAAREGYDYPPVLSPREFAALKSACEDDPDVEEFDFF